MIFVGIFHEGDLNKKCIPTALILYLNYFIHGIGCSIMSQQVVKEMLAVQWGGSSSDVSPVLLPIAALGLGRLISLPFAGPLSDKLGRRVSVLIGVGSYSIYFIGLAFSPSMSVAYVCAVLGGIANSFLDTATYPAVTEIFYDYTGIANIGIKLFISISQLLLPSVFLGMAVGSALSYDLILIVCVVALIILGVLAIFAPFLTEGSGTKEESFFKKLKSTRFSLESITLILLGFTTTGTFQLWLNCAQTFGKDVAGIPVESVARMGTLYSAGTFIAIFVTSVLITKIKQVRLMFVYPACCLVGMLLVVITKTPAMCYVGAFVIGFFGAGGVLQMVSATANALFPNIKGTVTSLVMIASSLCNYTLNLSGKKHESCRSYLDGYRIDSCRHCICHIY